MAHEEGQRHPIKIYLIIWGWLFVLSAMSYLVDYFEFESYLRWILITLFMMLKAGLIVSFFMHMFWERMAPGVCHFGPAAVGACVCGHRRVRGGVHPRDAVLLLWSVIL